MELTKITQMHQLLDENKYYPLLALCLVRPSQGKVKSISEALYGKQQGAIFALTEEGQTLGIIGGKVIDNTHFEIHHLAVAEGHRGKGYAKWMMNTVSNHLPVKTLTCEVSHKMMTFFKRNGFTCVLQEDEQWGSEMAVCTRSISKR